ncbi:MULTISPECIES: ROK family protein [unclassified Mucilaginibacter]|uniref:ROK family protein n=1 Tax=unclassified Mucilaginibacter TaxID=2617802 RepID=UPI00095F2B17|nr:MULTISPECIES: ROK family protein [unclassified Mucilaginibacter]OJW17614.1 MAG: chromosome partitioning protein ParA [Mucilaginibacter sp. 44-25]PAW92962.1 chromosome partitioning protein ParA [Mucilaginibacter sp. MD40]PLW89138.1 MAG: ROK family protein [Mucilaginibacter sp.]HEK20953.1 ROK family protein [Bacteroidota bacterium]
MKTTPSQLRILSIDIGGSSIKATILDSKGNLTMDYEKIATPKPANPDNVIKAIKTLVKNYPEYNRVSVGFPGYVRNGIVKTAPNLGTDFWADFDFRKTLTESLGQDTQVVNDADMQGLGVVKGEGLEMVITLGTGFGTALLMDGHLLPHLEVSHHPVSKGRDYDQYIGDKALDEIGEKKWNRRIRKVFKILKTVFNYDYLYIGGGNSDLLDFKLDKNMKIVTNADGIKGGARLWQEDKHPVTHVAMATPTK